MALHVFVYVSLLVVCLLLPLARLGRLDWFPLRPSSSRGKAKRTTLHRLLKPRCPDDCPACRLASTPSSGGGCSNRTWWIIRQAPVTAFRAGFRHWTDQTGHLFPEPGSIRVLLRALMATYGIRRAELACENTSP